MTREPRSGLLSAPVDDRSLKRTSGKEHEMIIGRKWLYAAMAFTGGFLGGIAAMECARGVVMAAAADQTSMLPGQFELADNSGGKRAVSKVTTRGKSKRTRAGEPFAATPSRTRARAVFGS
jgi:hypothetical protein